MSAFVKPFVLAIALAAGAAVPAYAQSTSIAALPPGDNVAPPAATAPLGPTATDQAFPTGPRNVWNDVASMHPAAPFIGPAPSSDAGDNSGE